MKSLLGVKWLNVTFCLLLIKSNLSSEILTMGIEFKDTAFLFLSNQIFLFFCKVMKQFLHNLFE